MNELSKFKNINPDSIIKTTTSRFPFVKSENKLQRNSSACEIDLISDQIGRKKANDYEFKTLDKEVITRQNSDSRNPRAVNKVANRTFKPKKNTLESTTPNNITRTSDSTKRKSPKKSAGKGRSSTMCAHSKDPSNNKKTNYHEATEISSGKQWLRNKKYSIKTSQLAETSSELKRQGKRQITTGDSNVKRGPQAVIISKFSDAQRSNGSKVCVQLGVDINDEPSGYWINAQTPTSHNKWKCIYAEEIHPAEITALTSFEHYLISSSTLLNVWDINKKSTVSKISGLNHTVLYSSDTQKILLTGSEKNGSVSVYSIPNLKFIKTIETGLSSIYSLCSVRNIVLVGGAGSAGSLQLWDLSTMTKLCEREKTKDASVYSVFTKNSTIYYGSNNRYVNRMNFDTLVTSK